MIQLSLASGVLAFCIGLFLGEAFRYFPLTLSVLGLVFLCYEYALAKKMLLSVPLFLIGGAGIVFFQINAFSPSSASLSDYVDQGAVNLQAVVASPPEFRSKYSTFVMTDVRLVESGQLSKLEGQFKLTVSGDNLPFVSGDRLEMQVYLRPFRQYLTPGSFLYGDYRRRSGWTGRASLSSQKALKKVGESGQPLVKRVYGWRAKLRVLISTSLDMPVAGLFSALILGDRQGIDPSTRKIFVNAGLAHLLAVSGTHLSFVALCVFNLSRLVVLMLLPASWLLKLSLWKTASQCATLPTALAVILYAFLAGGRIGTLRALFMILVYLLSIWLGRTRSLGNSLALAALLILLFSPQAIFDLSFQLSFGAVLSIVLVGQWWQARKAVIETETLVSESFFQRWCWSPLKRAAFASSAAGLGTIGLTLFYFHQFSWVGPIANILLLPIAGMLLIPFALGSVLIGFALDIGLPFAKLQTVLWQMFLEAVSFFAQWPGADWHFASPPLWLLILFYSVLFWMLVSGVCARTLLMASAAFVLVFLGWGRFRILPESLRVTIIDVGQGDAALIEFQDGKTVLIDGGKRRAGRMALLPFLWQRRIRDIDLVVATHPQFDHIGGLSDVLQAFPVKTVISNGRQSDSETFLRFESAIRETKAVHLKLLENEKVMPFGRCRLHFFGDSLSDRREENAHSIVIKLVCINQKADTEDFSLLFTGDIGRRRERALLAQTANLKSTVLKVPHHGSRYSSHQAFLNEVSPQIALVSAGRKNRYGHPHPDTLKRLQNVGAELYRTDLGGSLIVEWKDGEVLVSRHKENMLQPVFGQKDPRSKEWSNLKNFFSGY